MILHKEKIKLLVYIILLLGIIQTANYIAYHISSIGKESAAGNNQIESVNCNLNKIRQRGKLIALTDNSSTSYFVYKGEPMGYEFELLNSFAKSIGVSLEIVIARDMNEIFYELNNGTVDIVAANLTVTRERSETVSFTEPLMLSRQVLVQRKPGNWQKMSTSEMEKKLLRNTIELINKKIHVRCGSSFYSRLINLSEEIGGKINIVEAPGNQETEQLIGKVANGEIEYTIADENVALLNQTYYPDIDVRTAISFPQKISWATRKNSDELLNELNKWILKKETTLQSIVLYNKYFRSPKEAGKRMESDFFSQKGNKISVYDNLIKTHCKKVGWDWRLLASMIYQESHFDPYAQSWAGSYGLMQIIPATSLKYGIDSIAASPEESISAGTKYLTSIDHYWKDFVTDKSERIKFVLASYNVGLGHVIDARNLAMKYSRDPNIWEDNVGFFILQKSNPRFYNDPIVKYGYCRGQEPSNYVKEILTRFEHYKNVIDVSHPEGVIAGVIHEN